MHKGACVHNAISRRLIYVKVTSRQWVCKKTVASVLQGLHMLVLLFLAVPIGIRVLLLTIVGVLAVLAFIVFFQQVWGQGCTRR